MTAPADAMVVDGTGLLSPGLIDVNSTIVEGGVVCCRQ